MEFKFITNVVGVGSAAWYCVPLSHIGLIFTHERVVMLRNCVGKQVGYVNVVVVVTVRVVVVVVNVTDVKVDVDVVVRVEVDVEVRVREVVV